MTDANDVLFNYITHGDPSSTEHTDRYLRRYPQFRREIIELAAVWRAISTIEFFLEDTGAVPHLPTFSRMKRDPRRPVARRAEVVHA